jgi:hypothetical protein
MLFPLFSWRALRASVGSTDATNVECATCSGPTHRGREERRVLYITSGNWPIQPIIAIRPGARGDISLKENQKSNAHIAWSKMRGGPYMPTPILYGPDFYTCSNSGVLACYEAATGKELYKQRISRAGDSYTASPEAADGRIYFVSEQGQVRVVKAGPEFKLLAVNKLDDYVMATPAISNGSLFVRSQHFLLAFGKKADAEAEKLGFEQTTLASRIKPRDDRRETGRVCQLSPVLSTQVACAMGVRG